MPEISVMLNLKELTLIRQLRDEPVNRWEDISNGEVIITLQNGYIIGIRLEERFKVKKEL